MKKTEDNVKKDDVIDKNLENVNSLIKSKMDNINNMKNKLRIAKYSFSLTGNNNNIDIKKLRKAIAREFTEINKLNVK